MDTLREHVLDLIDGADEVLYQIGDDQVEPSENATRGNLIDLFVKCRESNEPNGPMQEAFENFAQRNKVNVEEWLDNYYFYPQLWAIPEMVRRTVLLSRMDATLTPSPQTNFYIAEASRCYIQGLLLGAVALARAALEQSLKEAFERLNVNLDNRARLRGLVGLAGKHGIFTADEVRIAKGLVDECNRVMHARPARNEDDARVILIAVRSIITRVFSNEFGN
jgi:hypothetical protein